MQVWKYARSFPERQVRKTKFSRKSTAVPVFQEEIDSLEKLQRPFKLNVLHAAPVFREDPAGRSIEPQRKQRTNGMDEETGQRLLEKIGRVTNDISEISKNEFSIDRLAKLVGSNSHYVSKVINDYYGKNFATLLGEARVAHACKMLCDMGTYGNMTIETIAQELGFKSRSNFVTVFKKITGLTPSEYRKINREVEGVKA